MRISTNSVFIPFQRNLEDIQYKQSKLNLNLTTGKDINSISDDPKRMVNAKEINNVMERNKSYLNNIDQSLGEMQVVDTQLGYISDALSNVQQLVVDSTNVSNSANLSTLGVEVKGMLNDLVKHANLDFNGHYVFSGTKTTDDSIKPTGNEKNTQPYELVQGTPSTSNPSGLEVHYKGNDGKRIINKDGTSTEQINYTGSDLFGKNGTELFDKIVQLYNKITYKSDGTARTEKDPFVSGEIDNDLNSLHAQIATLNESMNNIAAQNGSRINRLQIISDQMKNENTQLDAFRSQQEDTDVAQTTLDLRRTETALQYTLQVGSQLIQKSLFDFLG